MTVWDRWSIFLCKVFICHIFYIYLQYINDNDIMAKTPKEVQSLHDKKWELVLKIRSEVKEKDSNKKFENLIKFCKELDVVVYEITKAGYSAQVYAKKFSTDYWKERYDKFKEYEKSKSVNKKEVDYTQLVVPQKKIVKSENTVDKKTYYISICWTVKPEYCVCDSIIDSIKKYFETMKCTLSDGSANQFPDRVEYQYTYKLKTTQDVYKAILTSSKYILEMSTSSIYDNCNIGIFGKTY